MTWANNPPEERAVVFGGQQPRSDGVTHYFLGTNGTASGVDVTPATALTSSAIWAAVSLISNNIGMMPLRMYERKDARTKEEIIDGRMVEMVADEPNPEMTAPVFMSTVMGHALIRGNGYAEIEFDGAGRAINLWPLNPDYCEIVRRKDGMLALKVENPNGGEPVFLPSYSYIHIPGFSYDGICGYNVVTMARESWGMGIALERYGASLFGNSARPSGILSTETKLQPEAIQNLKNSWNEQHQGLSNAHRVAVLHSGLKWTQMALSAEDAQFIESKEFSIADVARWFHIPPHKLRDLRRATFSNIEHQAQEYITDALQPWMVRWEKELKKKLLWNKKRQFFRFDTRELLRGDFKSRMEAWKLAREAGLRSADDIAYEEDWNPLPDGQGRHYWMPLNYRSVEQLEMEIKRGETGNPADSGDTGDQGGSGKKPDAAGSGGSVSK